MQNIIIFDTETAPLDESQLLATFEPTFEPNKTLKDPAKIEADLAAKRASWIESSALHAERGRVLCIGWTQPKCTPEIIEGDERHILTEFIGVIAEFEKWTFAGFNILGFDLPFIRKRCLINDIPFPYYDRRNKWEPWQFKTFDAMLDWQSGDRRASFVGLDTVARALGFAGKTDHIGAEFGKVYAEDPERALAYLANDVEVTAAVCERLMK